MASVISSSQDSTLPSKAEWCFECYRGLAGTPIKEAKFRILCQRCDRSLYLCENHVDAMKCPGCGPLAQLSRFPASNVSPSTAATDDVAFGLLKDARIEGLDTWLASLSLDKYLQAAILWCHEEGASSLQEIFKNWEQLADALSLKPLEKTRMSQDPRCIPPKASIPPSTPGLFGRDADDWDDDWHDDVRSGSGGDLGMGWDDVSPDHGCWLWW